MTENNNKQKDLFNKHQCRYDSFAADSYVQEYTMRMFWSRFVDVLKDSNSILEVGCGGHTNFVKLGDLGISPGTYDGVDISDKLVEMFEQNTPDSSTGYCADFTSQAFDPGKKYDCLLFIGVLHHMTKSLDAALEKCSELVKDGGHVVFVEPNVAFLDFARRIWYRFSDEFDDENERALSIEEITDLCENHGFSNIKKEFCGNAGFFVACTHEILKLPWFARKLLFRPLFHLDVLLAKLNWKYISAQHISVWKNNGRPIAPPVDSAS
ncbi:MAG: class I SAM-dependent methyltransferase [Betaproteobacteria bacterium]|nr:class I SAM-dependent methyltransferase [Betaproteobacteria bacterium]